VQKTQIFPLLEVTEIFILPFLFQEEQIFDENIMGHLALHPLENSKESIQAQHVGSWVIVIFFCSYAMPTDW
jgi:hypothetical protein